MAETAQLFFESLDSPVTVTDLVGRPENLYFDVKMCSAPFSSQDQEHLAEALSGFANSDGGVLIYGLIAKGGDRSKPDVVTSVDPVKNLSKLHPEALSLVGQLVEPPVPGVRVEERQIDRLRDSGFLLIYVPPSEMAHRSRKDREFYRRHGTGFYRMEYYEIAEMFGRRRRPTLTVRAQFKRFANVGGVPKAAEYVITLENVGRGIAKFPGVLLKETATSTFGVDGCGNFGLPRRPTANSQDLLFGGWADHVIYPQSTLDVTVIQVNVFSKGFGFAPQQAVIEYELYAEDMPTIKDTLKLPEIGDP